MDAVNKLGWIAAEYLLNTVDLSSIPKENIGVVLANRSGSLDVDERFLESTRTVASPALFVYTLPNIVIGEICIRHGIKGENTFFVAENFDIPFLKSYTEQLFESEAVDACIIGWVEQYHNEYEAALYLIQKTPTDPKNPFTVENVLKYYS